MIACRGDFVSSDLILVPIAEVGSGKVFWTKSIISIGACQKMSLKSEPRARFAVSFYGDLMVKEYRVDFSSFWSNM